MPAYFEPTSGAPPIHLDRGVTVFGTDVDCDISLTDSGLATRHFAVAQLKSGHAVCDLGSHVGVSINGERIIGRQKLVNNDVVNAGDIEFTYRTKDFVRRPLFSPNMFPRLNFANILMRRNVKTPVKEKPDEFVIKPIPIRPGSQSSSRTTKSDDIEPDPNRPAPKPQLKTRPKLRRRNSDLGTRTGDRRKLLAMGKSKSATAGKRPTSARLMDAHCPDCKLTFCHVADVGNRTASRLSNKAECHQCQKKIAIKREDRIDVFEQQWSQPTWDSVTSGLDALSTMGTIIAFLVMVQFTMLVGEGVGKYGAMASSTIWAFQPTEIAESPSLLLSGGTLAIFAIAPITVLAMTRIVAEEFTMSSLGAIILGGLISPFLWKFDAGTSIARFGFFLYAMSSFVLISAPLKFADTKETRLTRTIPIALTAFLIAAVVLLVGCFMPPDNTGQSEIIASHHLPIWAIAAGTCWVAAQVCQLQYQRGVSDFLREPMLTKTIEECSVFIQLFAACSLIALALVATGTATGTASDLCWLIAGFSGVANTLWFLQVARFTRYTIC